MKRPGLYLLLLCSSLVPASYAFATFESEFVHCSDFGCKTRNALEFEPAQWQRIQQVFAKPALSPWLEKQQIRQAIALMEQYSGAIVGTAADLGANYNGEDLAHQMDCIDESTNTWQYLKALERRDLLQWHRVEYKLRRRTWFIFAHWSAVIVDLHDQRKYVVDSWYEDNGQPPYLQEVSAWLNARPFSEQLNPAIRVL